MHSGLEHIQFSLEFQTEALRTLEEQTREMRIDLSENKKQEEIKFVNIEARCLEADVDNQKMRKELEEITKSCAEMEERMKQRNKEMELRISTLETAMTKAVDSMFPLVEILLRKVEGSVTQNELIIGPISSTSAVAPVKSTFLTSNTASASYSAMSTSGTISAVSNLINKGSIKDVSSTINEVSATIASVPQTIQLFNTTNTQSTLSRNDSSCQVPPSNTSFTLRRPLDLEESLRQATNIGDANEVRRLITDGANVNAGDVTLRRALHIAAERGFDEIAHILLRAGAYVDAKEITEWTPLHSAAAKGQVTVVALLLRSGANVDSRKRNRWTPLHCAVFEGREECARLLLKAGADVAAKDKWGKTPLNIASTDAVRRLLRDVSGNQ